MYEFTLFLLLLGLLGYFGGTAFVTILIVWRFLADYSPLIFKRKKRQYLPLNWRNVLTGDIPPTDRAKRARVKGKLSSSCEIHGKCVARVGWYGTVSHPLKMDE